MSKWKATRLLLLVGLFSFSSSLPAVVFHGEGPLVCVWSYSPFTTKVTEHKLAPFVEALSDSLKAKVRLDASNNLPLLHQSAEKRTADLVLGPQPMTRKLPEQYGYEALARFALESHVFVRPEKSDMLVTEIKRLGVIKGTTTQRIVRDELLPVNPNVELVEYGNLFEIVRAFNRDHLDAFATIKGTVSVHVDAIGSDLISIHHFEQVAYGVILMNPDLDDEVKQSLKDFIFSDDRGMKAFGQAFGLGPVKLVPAE
jgi:hypothetical protein